MRETLPTLAATEGQPNVASPHQLIDDTLRVIENRAVDAVAPAGAVWSSVSDMARWMRFVLDSGRVGGKRLVSEARFIDWLAPQSIVPLSDFYPTTTLAGVHRVNYGLGWFLHSYAGDEVAMHTGSIDGMSAMIGLIPARRMGVYILANRDHAELRHALLFRAFDLAAGRPARDWSSEIKALYDGLEARGRAAQKAFVDARVAGTSPSLPLDRYVGQYADSLSGIVDDHARRRNARGALGRGLHRPARALALRHLPRPLDRSPQCAESHRVRARRVGCGQRASTWRHDLRASRQPQSMNARHDRAQLHRSHHPGESCHAPIADALACSLPLIAVTIARAARSARRRRRRSSKGGNGRPTR